MYHSSTSKRIESFRDVVNRLQWRDEVDKAAQAKWAEQQKRPLHDPTQIIIEYGLRYGGYKY